MNVIITFLNLKLETSIIHYTIKGKGKSVVLLHGFLEASFIWNGYVDLLSKSHQVVTIDLLGHGKTTVTAPIFTMEAQADMVREIMKKENINQAHLVGHSMGGYIALAFLEKFPEMVQKVTLLNSTSLPDNEERKALRDRAMVAVQQNKDLYVGMAIANLFAEDSRTLFAHEIEEIKKEAQKTSTDGIIACIKGMKIRKDRTFLLQQNLVPIQVILGEKDPVLPMESQEFLKQIPYVKVFTFPDGHMSWLENKTALYHLMEELL
jgi:pimeloyl-ACP methyl ester carboxylesterase